MVRRFTPRIRRTLPGRAPRRDGGLQHLAHGSMPELRQAWQAVDNRAHANRFLPVEQLENALHGWEVEYQMQAVTLWFDDALSAMRSLKGIGATHLHEGRETSAC